jgi:hypothetical protein
MNQGINENDQFFNNKFLPLSSTESDRRQETNPLNKRNSIFQITGDSSKALNQGTGCFNEMRTNEKNQMRGDLSSDRSLSSRRS